MGCIIHSSACPIVAESGNCLFCELILLVFGEALVQERIVHLWYSTNLSQQFDKRGAQFPEELANTGCRKTAIRHSDKWVCDMLIIEAFSDAAAVFQLFL